MALADLLMRLENRVADTADTSCYGSAVSVVPSPKKDCTPDTSETSQNFNAEDWAPSNAWLEKFMLGADDRRTCRQCSNLSVSDTCIIAYPGGPVSARRSYRPPPDTPQRCNGFVPLSDDIDQYIYKNGQPTDERGFSI